LNLLTRKEEILLYLSEQTRDFDIVMPLASTQRGISEALDYSQTRCSWCLAELSSAGLVKWRLAHIPELKPKLKAYVITAKADPLIKVALQKLEAIEALDKLSENLGGLELALTITPKVRF
jgi:hypothetical protein